MKAKLVLINGYICFMKHYNFIKADTMYNTFKIWDSDLSNIVLT